MVIIFWRGFGICVPVVGLGCLIVMQLITDSAFGAKYYQVHSWPKLAGCWLAAALTYALSIWLNRQPARVLIDKATGREIVLKRRDALFFIPVAYWAYIFLALGVVVLFM
jgi:hypothetical protein